MDVDSLQKNKKIINYELIMKKIIMFCGLL